MRKLQQRPAGLGLGRWGPWALTCLCLLPWPRAQAAHPLLTDDTGTQGAGRWQLELNADHTRDLTAPPRGRTTQANATITHGVSDELDLALSLPAQRLRPAGAPGAGGWGDLVLQAKWRVYGSDDDGGSLALKPMLWLPSGDQRRGLGAGRAAASLGLLAAWKAGAWTALGNLGASYNGNRAGDRTALWNASAALLYTPVAGWTLAADVGARRNPQRGDAGTLRHRVLGLIWHVEEAVDVDLGWRRERGGGPSTSTWGAGLTLRW